jgi:hypothetical protein
LRRGLRGGREIEHEDRDEVAAALEVGDAALDPQRGHGAVGTLRRSMPKSSVIGTPSFSAQVA